MLNLPKQKQQKIHNLLKKHSHRNLLILRTESQLSKCTNSAMFWHLSETVMPSLKDCRAIQEMAHLQ